MARMLWCGVCEALAAVTEDKPKLCATCGNAVEWRETDGGFTLTHMDRKLLKSFKIAVN